jgi:putative flippase GtrA
VAPFGRLIALICCDILESMARHDRVEAPQSSSQAEKVRRVWRAPLEWRFLRFLLVGGLNTAFGYGVFALLISAGLTYPVAAFVSTAAGILFNFKSYGTLVFRSHDNRKLLRFVGVYAICYGINLLPLAWAKRQGVSLLVVGAVVAVPMALLGFTLNRRYVFSPEAGVS